MLERVESQEDREKCVGQTGEWEKDGREATVKQLNSAGLTVDQYGRRILAS